MKDRKFLLTIVFLFAAHATVHGGDTCTVCKCTPVFKYIELDCSSTNVTAIPNPLPENTYSLNMSHTLLGTIRGSPFLNASYLAILDLFDTSLENISVDVFKGLTNLKYLNISNNKNLPLTNNTVPAEFFQGLTSLVELRMYRNTASERLGTYPDKALSQLTSLTTLWLDGMSSRIMGEGFANLTHLNTVIYNCGPSEDYVYSLTEIVNGTFDYLINLTHLVIYDCDLQTIHNDSFVKLKHLTYLDLSFNHNLGLDKALTPLNQVTYSSISVLKLNNIYDRLRMPCGPIVKKNHTDILRKLQVRELHMESNAIESVERGALVNLTSLEAIHVRDNEFEVGTYIVETCYLTNLKWIDISYQFFPTLLVLGSDHLAAEARTGGRLPEAVTTKRSIPRYIGHYNQDRPNTENQRYSELNSKELPSFTENEYMLDYFRRDSEMKRRSGHVTLTSRQRQCQDIATNLPYPIRPKLPPKLEYIDLSHSKLAHPICNFSMAKRANNSIREIHAAQSMLYCWDGPVDGLQGLEYLDLRLNFCTRVRLGFFDLFPNLKVLLIGSNLLGLDIGCDKNGELLDKLVKLVQIDISMNRLEKIPYLFFKSTYSLERIDASRNLLTSFDVKLDHMHQLKFINLTKNHISRVDRETYRAIQTIAENNYKLTNSSFILDLTNNSLQCTCNNINFLKWIFSHQAGALTVEISNCIFANDTDVKLAGGELGGVIKDLESACKSYFGLALGLSLLGVVLVNIIIGTILYRYRWKLRYIYYVAGRKIRKKSGYISMESMADLQQSFKYDVYVVSSEDDRDFVLGEMATYLRDKSSLRVCIQEVDFIPGQNVFRMIANAVHVSRVSLFVATRNSLQDREWEIAMRMCQEESLQRGQQNFFAVFIEDIPENMLHHEKMADIRNVYRSGAFVTYPAQSSSADIYGFWEECLQRIKTQ